MAESPATAAPIEDEKREMKRSDSLIGPDWAEALVKDPSNRLVLNATDLMLGKTAMPADHIFTAFLKTSLLRDYLSVFSKERAEVVTLFHLGRDVCGHPEITHGGLTSAMQDESLGILVYMLKDAGLVAKGPAFTARLEVDFRKPIPSETVVMCKCWLESTERRKIWLRSEVRAGPEGTLFAEGRALFVNAKEEAFKGTATLRSDAFQRVDSQGMIDQFMQGGVGAGEDAREGEASAAR